MRADAVRLVPSAALLGEGLKDWDGQFPLDSQFSVVATHPTMTSPDIGIYLAASLRKTIDMADFAFIMALVNHRLIVIASDRIRPRRLSFASRDYLPQSLRGEPFIFCW